LAIDPDAKLARQDEILLQKDSKYRSNFIRRIIDEITYPSVYTVLAYMNFVQRFKSYFHKSKIKEFEKYREGQKIALVAIWEYQSLRTDVRVLLEGLNKRDFYVCLVNTGKMSPDALSGLASVYIERFNYGRDFGSYKEGIQYLQKNNKLYEAENFLLCNDSVYYLQDLVLPTLDQALDSDLEIVGATENFEIVHHLGSFFMMFSKYVVNTKEFKKFWRRFRVTDIRTKNIRYGEMRLTEKMKKTVVDSKLGALWSLSYMSKNFDDIDQLSHAITLVNRGHVTSWKKLSWQFITKSFLDERILFPSDFSKRQGIVLQSSDGKSSESNESELILTHQDAVDLISENFNKEVSSQTLLDLKMKAKGLWVGTTGSGSQIHQNNNLLVSMGCPLVKLDLIYRGAFSYEDAEIMFAQIDNKEDVDLLRDILYRRAYGLDVLRGWKRSAFNKGLI
jgi:hypothetical protein